MKRLFSAFAVLCILLSMLFVISGCASDTDVFVGKWEAELDMTDTINEKLTDDEEMEDYLKVKQFSVSVVFTFKDDGTYTYEADSDKFSEAYSRLISDFREGMNSYLENVIEENGLDMTPDELLALQDTTVDDILEQAFTKELFDEMVSKMSVKGNYRAENGRLYTTTDEDDDIDRNSYEEYEIVDKNEIKLTKAVGEDSEDTKEMYPVTLYKR